MKIPGNSMSGNFSSGNNRDAINPTIASATNTTIVVTGLASEISVCLILIGTLRCRSRCYDRTALAIKQRIHDRYDNKGQQG